MEKVQCRATKMVYDFKNMNYEKRLDKLNMFSLQHKRMRGDMIETYKILSGLEDVNSSQFFTMSMMNNLRGHRMKLYKENLRKAV